MTKEEKALVIESIAAQLGEYPHFYITDIEALNAQQTAALRRKCFVASASRTTSSWLLLRTHCSVRLWRR